jgi:16S rRNA (guanine966-N2)-methyltransferase
VTRIVSGTWRGRRLAVPRDRRVRPTAERVREAWLNILAPELVGATVLDLFAGTGALGLEALSRGARHATFVEAHRDSLAIIAANVASLGATDRITMRHDDVLRFVTTLAPRSFDLALADPPFDSDAAERLVAEWQAQPFSTILAVEHPRGRTLPGDDTRHWGDIAVTFLRAR